MSEINNIIPISLEECLGISTAELDELDELDLLDCINNNY